MKKKIFSFLLSICMMISLLSGVTISSFAEDVIAPAVEAVSESEKIYAGDFTIAPTGAVEDAAASDIIDIPAIEDIPNAFPFGEGGERSETEKVLRETSPTLRAPSPEGRTEAILPIETAAAEDVTAELQASYSGSCGSNVKWSLNTSTGKLNISGTGKMTDWSDSSAVPWYNYWSSIKTVTIGNGVTSIGKYAFYDCISLTSVTIPDSVTSIGSFAFYDCASLTSVTIPDSVTSIRGSAFYDCDSLTSVHVTDFAAWCGISFGDIYSNPLYYAGKLYLNGTLLTEAVIPAGVTAIPDYAFSNCDSLTSVTIPDSVTSIRGSAFRSCDSLTSIDVSENNPAYSSQDGVLFNKDKTTLIQCPGGKSGAYTIPDSVTSIGSSAFYSCDSLASVTIGNGVTSVGERAFYNCDSLTSVTIPDSVTSIGNSAFRACTSLTSVTIRNGVTAISDYAFYDCDSLTSVTIGNSVTSIGNSAFDYCGSLTSVTIPSSVTSIGSYAFYGCSKLTSVIYCGTQAQWNKISIDSGNDPLENAARQYHTEHTFVSDQVVIPATCTGMGSKSCICIVCGASKTEAIPALGHDYIRGAGVDATCTEPGWEALTCSRCGDDQYHDLEPLPHNWDSGTATKPATCTDDGVRTYTCTACGASKTDAIPALGHDYVRGAGVDATCTEPGWAALTCFRCGDDQYRDFDPLGHELTRHSARAVTCEAIGWNAYDTCSRCDYTTRGADIPALGHNYAASVTTAATCTADGVMTYTCSHDTQHTYTEVIPALGHDMQIKQHIPPSKEEAGYQVRICSRCGLTKNTVLPKLGADPGDLNDDGERNAKDVTFLRRFLAGGYDVTLANELIADVNMDGIVNAKDLTILRRFLAGGYGVELS